MMDWSKLPDLGAVVVLTCAFAAAGRRSEAPGSGLWLTGWIMIVIHFAAFVFSPLPGAAGNIADFIGVAALSWAGVLFMLAALPDRTHRSATWMFGALLSTYTLYIAVVIFAPTVTWALVLSALLLGLSPLAIALLSLKAVNHPLRWIVVVLHLALGGFLLAFQQRSGNGAELALNASLFSVYFGCCLYFAYAYRRLTAGAFVTTAGFLCWAGVFAAAPTIGVLWPTFHVESEVWNLPKYIVAVGMILLLLEEQIEHNKYLALHDELSGLPNRRLFQDRLDSALERARRLDTQAALLLIDLDHFKQVNDTVGHHIGDKVLQRASSIFLSRVRRSDTVARTGGDEFSIILEEPTSRQEADLVGRSLIQLLNQPFEIEGHTVRIGASVGIAIFPEDAATPEALRIAADLRMYERKNAGRTGAPRFKPGPAVAMEAPAEKSAIIP